MKSGRLRATLLGLVAATFASGCMGATLDVAQKSTPIAPGGFSDTDVFPGTYDFEGILSTVLTPGPFGVVGPVSHTIRSPVDGVDIGFAYWLPDVPPGTQVPAILWATPYLSESGGDPANPRFETDFFIRNFVPHGFAFAALGVRGTGTSGGCPDIMGPAEVADIDATVTWLGTQPWSNGNVGMSGASYDGSTPWMAASTGNSHLKTIAPQIGLPDLYSYFTENGSANIESLSTHFIATYWARGPELAGPTNLPPEGRPIDRRVEATPCPAFAQGAAASAYMMDTGARDPLGWFEERDHRVGVEENYRGSILNAVGLQDWNVKPHLTIPWVDALNQTGIPVKQIYPQMPHSYVDNINLPDGTARRDWAEILLRWFTYWLKEDHSIDLGPPAQVQDNTGAWRNEEHYPPRDATWQRLYPSAPESLASTPGSVGEATLVYRSAMMVDAPLPDGDLFSAVFDVAVEAEPLRIAGLPRFHALIVPSGTRGYVAGGLYDVAEDGTEERLGWSHMNLQFADGSESPRELTPGQGVVARMEFNPLDVVIFPGHTLRLRVWEETYYTYYPAVPPFPVTLQYGGETHTVLEIPVIERAADVFFEPPTRGGGVG